MATRDLCPTLLINLLGELTFFCSKVDQLTLLSDFEEMGITRKDLPLMRHSLLPVLKNPVNTLSLT